MYYTAIIIWKSEGRRNGKAREPHNKDWERKVRTAGHTSGGVICRTAGHTSGEAILEVTACAAYFEVSPSSTPCILLPLTPKILKDLYNIFNPMDKKGSVPERLKGRTRRMRKYPMSSVGLCPRRFESYRFRSSFCGRPFSFSVLCIFDVVLCLSIFQGSTEHPAIARWGMSFSGQSRKSTEPLFQK